MAHETKESAGPQPEKEAVKAKETTTTKEKTVEKNVAETKDKVAKAVPEVKGQSPKAEPESRGSRDAPAEHPGQSERNKRGEWPKWKNLPAAPRAATLGKAALTGLTVMAPPLGLTASAGVWGWNKVKKFPPFRWVNSLANKGLSTAKEGVKNVWEVGTYPLRVAGTVGGNALRTAGAAAYKTLDVTVLELYRDIRLAINHKFNFPENTNPLAAFLTGIKGVVVGAFRAPFVGLRMYGEAFKNRPLSTVLGTGLALGAIQQAGGILPAAGKLFEGVMRFIESAATKLGAPPPIPGVT